MVFWHSTSGYNFFCFITVRAAAAATTTEGGREEGFDIDASEEERSGVLLGKASLMVVIGLASFLLILF